MLFTFAEVMSMGSGWAIRTDLATLVPGTPRQLARARNATMIKQHSALPAAVRSINGHRLWLLGFFYSLSHNAATATGFTIQWATEQSAGADRIIHKVDLLGAVAGTQTSDSVTCIIEGDGPSGTTPAQAADLEVLVHAAAAPSFGSLTCYGIHVPDHARFTRLPIDVTPNFNSPPIPTPF